MKKPTPRMLFLMGLATRGGIRGSVWQTQKREPYHSFTNIQAVAYCDQAHRNPSNREILAMLATGWFEMKPDGCDTTDTQTGAVSAVGNRMWLTPEGLRLYHAALPPEPTVILPGEWRAPAATVAKYGTALLDALNKGTTPCSRPSPTRKRAK